jgi:RNA polymerase sigma-70 factor (ECF subfamily)
VNVPAARPETGKPAESAWFETELVALVPSLYATARRLARNEADAEDLVAEAVSRAWLGREQLRDRAAFRGWLFRILTNLFLTECRRRETRPPVEPLPEEDAGVQTSGFSLFERLHQPFLLWWSNPEQEFLDRLFREDLARAVDSLAEPFRVVVVLVELQGFSYQEVAALLEVPVGTVRSRLARGRSRLQELLWEYARTPARPAGGARQPTEPS